MLARSGEERVAARCSVERLSALLRYEDEVLVTQAESPSNIDPRFDAEDVADLERLDVALADVRNLMDLKPDTVSGSVMEVVAKASLGDHASGGSIDLLCRHSRCHPVERRLVRGTHRLIGPIRVRFEAFGENIRVVPDQ
jgi:hypothetical protein